ncbi:MAG TPA: carotenoid biosynthesis protein, partial [bacterium]
MVSEPMIRILFFAVFGFLALSMFFNRIFPRFGYTFPLRFIGVQIGLSVLTVFLHGTLVWGARDALLFIGLSTSIGLAAEWLGIKTGRVFGRYRYTAKSGPTCFGAVPVFVPLMWCVIAYMGFWTAAW